MTKDKAYIYSLRFRLLVIFFATIIIPSIVTTILLPSYYRNKLIIERESLTKSNLEAINRNIETYLDDLDRLTLMPYSYENIIEALRRNKSQSISASDQYSIYQTNMAIKSYLTVSLNNIRQDIRTILLVSSQESVYFYDRYQNLPVRNDYNFESQSWYQEALSANGKAVFTNFHQQDYLVRPMTKSVFSVARLIKDPINQAPIAVIMADADNLIIDRILKEADFGVSSIIIILDKNNELIYANKSLPSSAIQDIANNKQIVKFNSDSYSPVSSTIESSGWKLVVLLSTSETSSKIRGIFVTSLLVTIAQIFFAFLLFFFSTRSITTKFGLIRKTMQEAQNGNLHIRYTAKGKDELGIVGQELNIMIDRINDLIDREFRAELSKRNAEYNALQSQINPHFLYNTLNGLIGLNRLGQRDMLEKAIFSLTSMLRYILDQNDQSTIKKEFQLIERYIMLQKLRFGERLSADVYCEERLEEIKIPKLLIQPLVENAIIHGIEPSNSAGKITVEAKLVCIDKRYFAKIVVLDNGVGFDQDKNDNSSHVGITNVIDRLTIAFKNSEFTISSEIGHGTEATITIPMEKIEI